MRCPSVECKRFLAFSAWSKFVARPIALKYEENAKALLTIQCSSCHKKGTLYKPPAQTPQTVDSVKQRAVLMERLTHSHGGEVAALVQGFFAFALPL